MNNDIDQIKSRLDIVDLISGYLTLKKAGTNFRANCPFHGEKTPSFMVSPEKQIWHCFGCSEGGDIITFIMKMENLEFIEALKMLAQRAGVKLESKVQSKTEIETQDRKSRLYEVNRVAARTFAKILTSHPTGKQALEYLKNRQLNDETIKEFMIGYAPSSRAMLAYLTKHGFTSSELMHAGNPDRFFKRIMFPINDIMGNTIAFTGRVLEKDQEPKYLNTPETIIFHKGRVLFNLEKARGSIKQEKAVVVVEGQMDVIASWQAGVRNVVATSGTALTADHLKILARYSPNIIFAFDSDTAGLVSAKKAYEMAITEGFNVQMVALGQFKDPGEMIAAIDGPALWLKAVQDAHAVIDWYFSLAFGEENPKSKIQNPNEMTSQEKKEIAKEILPIIKKIPDTIEQAHYIGLLGKRLQVAEQVIFEALAKISEKPKTKTSQEPVKPTHKLTPMELLLGILLKRPEKLNQVINKISKVDFADLEHFAIYTKLCKVYNENKLKVNDPKKGQEFIKEFLGTLERSEKLKADFLVVMLENLEKPEEELLADIDLVIQKLKQDRKENLKSFYASEIQKAEQNKDLNRLKELIKEFQEAIK